MSIESLMQLMGGVLPPVLLALFGGTVRVLRGPGACSARYVFATIVTAAFTGYMVHLLLEPVAFVPEGMRQACVGVAGYAGGQLLDIIADRVCAAAKTFNPTNKR
ncbi:phage holin family protein [Desulfobaculum sp. SPO524]|uniref:phage holin family protein n=1 Tax=Desulfobaculum sp. SPO524 TaxID=3378071 RepID=UPI003852D4EF